MSSSGFGQWYDDKKAQDMEGGLSNESSSSSLSWFGIEGGTTESVLPMFNNTTTESMMQSMSSWNNMKSSIEAQMPKQILGMGYQQRFQVFCGLLLLSAIFFALAFFVGLPALVARPQKFAISFVSV